MSKNHHLLKYQNFVRLEQTDLEDVVALAHVRFLKHTVRLSKPEAFKCNENPKFD